MSNQYIYGQQTYNQNIQYDTGINTNDQVEINGTQFVNYETTNYQQTNKINNINMQPIVYQQYEQQEQPIYLDQNQAYQTEYIIQDQDGQIYEYQKGEKNVGYDQYDQYYQQQNQQLNQIYQYQQPQIQTIPQKQVKISQPIAQVNPNIPKNPPIGSRNPYIQRKQFQPKQNIQQINQENIHQPPQIGQNITETIIIPQNQNISNGKPLIESNFQPNIPMANSVLNQSKIPFRINQSNVTTMNPQIQQPQSNMQSKVMPLPQQTQKYQQYVIPRRNPNVTIKQYEYSNNDSHFVTTADPGSRTVPMNVDMNYNQGTSQNSLVANFELSQNEKEYADDKSEELRPEVGAGNSVVDSITMSGMKVGANNSVVDNITMSGLKVGAGNSVVDSITMSGMKNTEKNEMEKSAVSSIHTVANGLENSGFSKMDNIEQPLNDNLIQKKISKEEIEKENPIEQKFPDQNEVSNLENENNQDNNQDEESDIIDIDDKLEYLPTEESIMKGRGELLPPPKKRKYQ